MRDFICTIKIQPVPYEPARETMVVVKAKGFFEAEKILKERGVKKGDILDVYMAYVLDGVVCNENLFN